MQQAKQRSDIRRTELFILSYHEAFFEGGGGRWGWLVEGHVTAFIV